MATIAGATTCSSSSTNSARSSLSTTVERSRTLGGNPNAVGKDVGNWKTLYMMVMMRVMNRMMGNQD